MEGILWWWYFNLFSPVCVCTLICVNILFKFLTHPRSFFSNSGHLTLLCPAAPKPNRLSGVKCNSSVWFLNRQTYLLHLRTERDVRYVVIIRVSRPPEEWVREWGRQKEWDAKDGRIRINKGWKTEEQDCLPKSSMEQHWPLLADKAALSVSVLRQPFKLLS